MNGNALTCIDCALFSAESALSLAIESYQWLHLNTDCCVQISNCYALGLLCCGDHGGVRVLLSPDVCVLKVQLCGRHAHRGAGCRRFGKKLSPIYIRLI